MNEYLSLIQLILACALIVVSTYSIWMSYQTWKKNKEE